MTGTQVVCLIAIIVVSFLFGRYSKRIKLPIMGTLVFKEENAEPKMLFKCSSFNELKKFKHIVIAIDSRQNHLQ